MGVKKKLVLTFETETGGTEKIYIDNLKDNITYAEVAAVADIIIAQNVFYTNSGDFKFFREAQISTTTIEELV